MLTNSVVLYLQADKTILPEMTFMRRVEKVHLCLRDFCQRFALVRNLEQFLQLGTYDFYKHLYGFRHNLRTTSISLNFASKKKPRQVKNNR